MTTALYRPDPVSLKGAQPVDRNTSPGNAVMRLRKGERLVVTDAYSTGAEILDELYHALRPPRDGASYALRQGFKRAFRDASLRLLAPIKNHRLDLQDSQHIEFLRELYPDTPDFTLPFVQVQELFGAWQAYDHGVHMAVLGGTIHPYYGTYAPTRTSHLELFAQWLHGYEGPKKTAVDVGTGCGVLALLMARGGVEHILATDTNANAVHSVVQEVARRDGNVPIEPVCTDLLGDGDTPFDLVVFNPPWLKGEENSLLDRALYYEDELFERFFDQAHARVADDGRVVLVFSNILTLVQPDVPHPIERELQAGRFTLVNKLKRKVKATRSPGGRHRTTKERVEIWELKKA